MRKYLLHVLIISFVFLLTPIVPVASYVGVIETYKEEIRINPDFAFAHFCLGAAYRKSGKYQEAIKSFKQVIRIDPYSAGAHDGLGRAYSELGKKEEAIESYKKGR